MQGKPARALVTILLFGIAFCYLSRDPDRSPFPKNRKLDTHQKETGYSKLVEVSSDYPPLITRLDHPVEGASGRHRIDSREPKVTFTAVTSRSDELDIVMSLENARPENPVEVLGNHVLWKNAMPDVDLQFETYDGYLKQVIELKDERSANRFSFQLETDEKLLLDASLGGHIIARLAASEEELFMLRAPLGIDANGQRIDYRFQLGEGRLELKPKHPWQFENASYPIAIHSAVSTIQWNEALVKVGENCVGCTQDGDVVAIQPTGWNWGEEEKKKFVVVKVPKLNASLRGDIGARTVDDPDFAVPEEGTRLSDTKGLIRYAIDYTELARDGELLRIRDPERESPFLTADFDLRVIEKKADLYTSIIPQERRLAYRAVVEPELLTRIRELLVPPALAQTVVTSTIGSGGRDYSTLTAWEVAREGDITAAGRNTVEKAEIYNDSDLVEPDLFFLDGSITDATHYFWITVYPPDRHNGTAFTGAAIVKPTASGSVMEIGDEYTIVEWLVFKEWGSGSTQKFALDMSQVDSIARNNVFYGGATPDPTASAIAVDRDRITVYNNIIHNLPGPNGGIGIENQNTADDSYYYNNTVYDCEVGFSFVASAVDGLVRNNISVGNSSADYSGAFHASSSHNLDSDGTAPGTSALTSTAASLFVNTTAGSEDLHLKSGASAIDSGTDLSGVFADDIDGKARFAPWDIGADEMGLTQNHYRWRNDDGSEVTATWARAEDTKITDVPKNIIKRLRFGISNQGTLSTNAIAYELQFATSLSCTSVAPMQVFSGGEEHSCMLFASGEIQCWGANGAGQLGDGTTNPSPTPVSTGITGANQVTSGTTHACAGFPSGAVECWGANYFGEVGDGTTTQRESPVPVSGISNAVQVTAGDYHTCARLASGAMECWGLNSDGPLGDGTTTQRESPVPVSGMADAIQASAGFYHTCALRATGGVECWGRNDYGQVGDGTTTTPRLSPVPVVGLSGTVVEVEGGGFHTCVRYDSGTVECWGRNDDGQVGNGITSAYELSPVPVSGLSNVVELAAGELHTCALVASGSVYCWGANSSGQLGDNNMPTDSSSPVLVVGISNAVSLGRGEYHYCATLATGDIACWGANSGGQLGDGTTTTQDTPVSWTPASSPGSPSGYTAVPTDASSQWQITDSSFFTDGDPTTDVTPGLTNEATTFVAGKMKDTANPTGTITLGADVFTEIEFAVQATSNAAAGGNYCFRLYDATNDQALAYGVYAEALLAAADVNYRSIGTAADYGTTQTNGNGSSVTATQGSSIVTCAGTCLWLTFNRGRGDVIEIDGVPYTVAAVNSEAQLTLASLYTGPSTGGKSYRIRRQYATLQAWEDCISYQTPASCSYFQVASADLVADGRKEIGIAYNDSAVPANPDFTARVVFDGLTTDADHTVTLTADGDNRHYGNPGAGVLVDCSGCAVGFDEVELFSISNITIEWLEMVGFGGVSTSDCAIKVREAGSTNVLLRNLLVHDNAHGIRLSGVAGKNVTVRNSIVYNNMYNGIEADETTDFLTVENCTIYNNGWEGIGMASTPTANVIVRNTISMDNTGNDFGASPSPTVSYSVDSDGSLPACTGCLSSRVATDIPTATPNRVVFMNLGVGTENLHLQTSTVNDAVDTGMDLSASFTGDIDAGLRVTPWDVGADDLAATTSVDLVSFDARGLNGAIELTWETGSEINNLGFHLYRALTASGPYERITWTVVPGLGSSPEGRQYRYTDTGLTNGVTYYYKLEDIETTGKTEEHGPVWATPQLIGESGGEESGGEEETPRGARNTIGQPERNRLNILESRTGELVLELITEGFYAIRQDDGTVRLEIPEFALTEDIGSPAVPVRRTWVPVLAGQQVTLASVTTFNEETFDGLTPETAGAPAIEVGREGTVRATRQRRQRVTHRIPTYYPEQSAQLLATAFQEDVKKVLVEMAPLRWDTAQNRLVLAHRLVVRLSLEGLDLAEQTTSGRRGRRYPRPQPPPESGRVVTRWVTTEAGLYGVDLSRLLRSREGAPINADTLRLSRQGESVPFHIKGTTLYFVSVGGDGNPYGHEAVVELEVGVSGEQMATGSAIPGGASTPYYWELVRHEEDLIYQSALVDAPDRWLWKMLFAPARESFSFDVTALALTTESSWLHLWLQGASDFAANPDHHVQVYVNGTFVGETRWNGKEAKELDLEIVAGILVEGENVIEVENVDDTEATYSMVMLNRFEVSYPRRLEAVGGYLDGSWSLSGTAEVTGVSPEAHVLEKTSSGFNWLEGTEATATGIRFQAEAEHSYLVVSPDAVRSVSPRRVSQTSRLKTTSHQADYVLISPREFLVAVSPLLELRRRQGLRAKAVAIEDVYSEFGFGEENPQALKDLLAYAYHNWEQAPRYVVLAGDGTYDFKDNLGTGVKNQVPPMMVLTSYLETASDAAYAAVNGEDLLPDLAIGRLPAATMEELQTMVAKIVTFETSGNTFSGRAVLVSDNPDRAGDFVADAETLAATTLTGKDVEKIYLSHLGAAATRSQIVQAFDDGASLMNYIGHGGIHLWADEDIFNNNDVQTLALQHQQPLLLTMNCLNGYFHFPYMNALSEELLKAEGKGAVAAFSPSGLSVNSAAHVFHRLLLAELVSGQHTRLGDAVLAAQSAYADSGALPEMIAIYHLFGDPGMAIQ